MARDHCNPMETVLHPAVKLAEDRLRLHVRELLPEARVWLFGSRALQQARRRSDFDLAVQLGSGTPESALDAFEEAVASDPEIIYPVDVVDLRTATSALREAVASGGILWTS